MVITVTLNPCVDRTIEVEKFQYGGTNKVLMTRNDISGKGINVNLVLQHLGIENLATGFDYQEDTKKLTGFLDRLGCRYKLEPVEGSLRVNVKIFDCATSVMSEFNERGSAVTAENVDSFLKLLYTQMDLASVIVVDGSVPPGVPEDIYERIIEEAGKKGLKTILDASGELLKKGIKAKPFLIKPNQDELGATYGVAVQNLDDIIRTARKVIEEGVTYVCVSRGSQGAVLVSKEHVYVAEPLTVDIKGIQGAGDSMVAGFCYAIEKGMNETDLLRHAVACATGSLLHPGTQLCEKEDMEVMLSRVRIVEV